MKHDRTLYVSLDVHKDSITVAYALGMGEVCLARSVRRRRIPILCKRLQSKARHIRIVELGRIAPIGLDALIGLLWDQRRRAHHTVESLLDELAVKPITAGGLPRSSSLLSFSHSPFTASPRNDVWH